MDRLPRSLRLAARSLLRTSGASLVALVSLAIAIAATTTVVTLVDASLLRPPPFAQSDRLVMLYTTRRDRAGDVHDVRWSWRRLGLLRQLATSYSAVGSFSPEGASAA